MGHQFQELRPGHLRQHAFGQGVGLRVVANVNVQAIHDIEVRIGKELFHGRIAHIRPHTTAHEGLEIRSRTQSLHILHRRHRRLAGALDRRLRQRGWHRRLRRTVGLGLGRILRQLARPGVLLAA